VLQSERPTNRLFAVGEDWVQRREYCSLRETLEQYQNVTCEDVGRVMEEYPLSSYSTVAVGPLRELARPT
jgi:predicted Zn-dependent peptidase